MHISVYFLAQEYVRKGSEELFIPETILGWLENKEWLLKHLRCGFVVLLCIYVLFQSTDSYFVVHSIVRRGQCCQQSSPSIWLQSCACVFVCVRCQLTVDHPSCFEADSWSQHTSLRLWDVQTCNPTHDVWPGNVWQRYRKLEGLKMMWRNRKKRQKTSWPV